MSQKVITLVVPPGSGGVRDYADKMAHGLGLDGYDVRVFAWQSDAESGIDAHIAESDCIYLQYSGYGFANRGAPLWMLRSLRTRRPAIKRFGVYFHELYAFGPPWGSAFWLSAAQRHVAAKLAMLSDFWLTNRELSQRWLARHAATMPSATLPVFSNVGELTACSRRRDRKAIVFGSASVRMRTYGMIGSKLFDWARRHDLEIHDVGSAFNDAVLINQMVAFGVRQHGRLEPEAVSNLLSDAMFGILAYPVEYVAKSGVFAAYCAHGVAPILHSQSRAPYDGLESGKQYLTTGILTADGLAGSADVGSASWEWYLQHQFAKHVAEASILLGGA